MSLISCELFFLELFSIIAVFLRFLALVVLALAGIPLWRVLFCFRGSFAVCRPMEAWEDLARERTSCCHLLRHDVNWKTRESDAPERWSWPCRSAAR